MAANSIGTIKPADLPTPPQAALQIMRACSQEHANNNEISDLASQDPVLTAEILRVANSPFYGLGSKIQSIARAISVLGHKALRSLALCITVRDILSKNQIKGFDTASFWEDDVRRAVCARLLGEKLHLNADECFTAGLLQDFGLLVMFFVQQDKAGEWSVFRVLDPDARYLLEKDSFSTTHDQVVMMMARSWGLPNELTRVLGYHHHCDSSEIQDGSGPMCKVLHVADWMASVFTCDDKDRVIKHCRSLIKDTFDFTQDEIDELLAMVPEKVEQAASSLGMDVSAQEDFEIIMREANVRLAEENISYQELTWRLEKTLKERDELAEELNQELLLASEIQNSLLPGNKGKGFPVLGMNRAARELSGDFYDYFVLDDGRIYFNLGDVSGKGINAALLMAKTSSLFRCLGKKEHDPGTLMARINDEICETSIRGMFVTMIAGIYDPSNSKVKLVNAGNPPAILINKSGTPTTIDAQAPPLGIVPGCRFPDKEFSIAGGSLYLFSDGVTEGQLSNGNMLGVDGFITVLAKLNTRRPADRMKAIASLFHHSTAPLKDDITVVIVEDMNSQGELIIETHFPATAKQLKRVRIVVREVAEKQFCNAELVDRLVLAVNEACMNIIQHAYGENNAGEIILEILNNQGELVFRLTDFAEPVDKCKIKSRCLEEIRPGGLGVHLINEVMDSVRFLDPPEGVGNILEMRKTIT